MTSTVPVLAEALRKQFLLHGSVSRIDGPLEPSAHGLFATDFLPVALLKSVVSNHTSDSRGLSYSYSREIPLLVRVYGFRDDIVHDKGYVYVLPRDCFRHVKGWEYASSEPVRPLLRVPVAISDLHGAVTLVDALSNPPRVIIG